MEGSTKPLIEWRGEWGMGMMWLLQISAPIPEGFATTLGVWTITLSCHIKKSRGPATCPEYYIYLHQCYRKGLRRQGRCRVAVHNWFSSGGKCSNLSIRSFSWCIYTPTLANFRLPTWSHWTQSWEEMWVSIVIEYFHYTHSTDINNLQSIGNSKM